MMHPASTPPSQDEPSSFEHTSSPSPARTARKQATRERIIHSTIHLLMQEGLQAVSMNRISKAAGIAQPSFYNHYPSVEALIRDVRETLKARYLPALQEKFIAIATTLKQPGQHSLRELSQRYIEINMSVLLKNVALFRVILADYHHPESPAKGELGKIISDINSAWIELIRQLAAANNLQISDAPLRLYVDSMSALVHTLVQGVAENRYPEEAAVTSVALHSAGLINELAGLHECSQKT
jgi:TetR/AcrR family transcriptional regulator of autoinduction and epiphytic fitness